jgi:alpha-tubulin suppressor-like RCC1 family protein
MAASNSGMTFSWGEGTWGKLGLGDDTSLKMLPTHIPKGTPQVIAGIAGSFSFS